ncbi:hypothetical protein BRC81_06115 [Halobacteriales archaeon QS_1_68_20]|nr:MAG: hypothetical protein BRC81_06115 [Halobacteriales archaeon QS_1_68_20]
MSTNDPTNQNDTARTNAPAGDHTDETTRICPACDEPIQSTDRIGPVTYVLEPCGHQVDDRIHAALRS